ncbi:MAG TPA: hypothetical protein ACN46J_06480, partial [Prochlorococcus sp.]
RYVLPMIKLLTTVITTSFVLVVAPTASVAKHHHHDHYVCAIGYHYVGDGVCRRNGDWYQGRRHEYDYGLEYRPQPSGSVELFDGAVKIHF